MKEWQAADDASSDLNYARRHENIGFPQTSKEPPLTSTPNDKPVVLFVNSNGVGIGHLTRLLAIARRLSPAVQPWFLTLSSAPKLIRDFRIPCDYMPSLTLFPEQPELWNRMLTDRLSGMIDRLNVTTLVFDGTLPYRGLINARRKHRDIKFVWCRRGLWKDSALSYAQLFEKHFDAVIEPGERFEPPPISRVGFRAIRVPPILLLGTDELVARKSANRQLGLADDRDAILIQLGAGNINSLDSALQNAINALRQSAFRSTEICWSGSPISKTEPVLPGGVKNVSQYPISRFFKRFRFGISAAGYNSFHEHVTYGLPAIFIPNRNAVTDDQYARARAAEERGLAVVADNQSETALRRALDAMNKLLSDAPPARSPVRGFANGATKAAAVIESMD